MILNPFPDLLSLGFFAPFLLRLALGLYLVCIGYRHFKQRSALASRFSERYGVLGRTKGHIEGIFEVCIGLLLVAGLYTQIVALITAALALKSLYYRKRYPDILTESVWFYLFMCAVSLSLLVTGAGAFAFDVPL